MTETSERRYTVSEARFAFGAFWFTIGTVVGMALVTALVVIGH